MYTALTLFAALLGLAVTGTAVYTAWYLFQLRKGGEGAADGQGGEQHFQPAALLRWNVFDYALLALILTGLVFLLADLVGVLRERDLYPYYHYGYLLCGFIFTLLGFLFIVARLFLVLRLAGPGLSLPHDHHEPDQADEAE